MQLSRVPDEVNRVNGVRGLHFHGKLLPTESGVHQLQAAPGFVWKPATSIVDSEAINILAPSSVSAKALVESNGSLNSMTYRTVDGTRIPNLGLWRRSLRAARRNSAERSKLRTSQDP